MARRSVAPSTLIASLARTLERAGVPPGSQIPREAFDDVVMVGCGVGSRSVENYLAQGRALGYWISQPKHGKGGRGSVVFLGTNHDGAVKSG